MLFLRIDCGPLKQSLLGHCEAWVEKFTGLLNATASAELNDLYKYFKSHSAALAEPPKNLEQLADNVNLLKRLIAEKEETKDRFLPMQQKYRLLEKFEVPITEEEVASLEGLATKWTAFQAVLGDSDVDLERAKETFRDKLTKMVEMFVIQVADTRTEFEAMAPKDIAQPMEHAALTAAQKYLASRAGQILPPTSSTTCVLVLATSSTA